MAVGTWPADLPAPSRPGYSIGLPELNQRTSFALGSRVRPLFADGNDTVTATVILTDAQWHYLQGWIRYALHNGADWFSMPLLVSGSFQTIEARLTGPVRFDLYGIGYVTVSLPLETRTGTTMSQAEWDALNP